MPTCPVNLPCRPRRGFALTHAAHTTTNTLTQHAKSNHKRHVKEQRLARQPRTSMVDGLIGVVCLRTAKAQVSPDLWRPSKEYCTMQIIITAKCRVITQGAPCTHLRPQGKNLYTEAAARYDAPAARQAGRQAHIYVGIRALTRRGPKWGSTQGAQANLFSVFSFCDVFKVSRVGVHPGGGGDSLQDICT